MWEERPSPYRPGADLFSLLFICWTVDFSVKDLGHSFPWHFKGCNFMQVLKCHHLEIVCWQTMTGFWHVTQVPQSPFENKYLFYLMPRVCFVTKCKSEYQKLTSVTHSPQYKIGLSYITLFIRHFVWHLQSKPLVMFLILPLVCLGMKWKLNSACALPRVNWQLTTVTHPPNSFDLWEWRRGGNTEHSRLKWLAAKKQRREQRKSSRTAGVSAH